MWHYKGDNAHKNHILSFAITGGLLWRKFLEYHKISDIIYTGIGLDYITFMFESLYMCPILCYGNQLTQLYNPFLCLINLINSETGNVIFDR